MLQGSLECAVNKPRKSTLANDLHSSAAPPSPEFVKIESSVSEIPKAKKLVSKEFDAIKSTISLRYVLHLHFLANSIHEICTYFFLYFLLFSC